MNARLEDPERMESHGYSFVHLNQDFSVQEALKKCSEIARITMTARDYYDLKAFSYFPSDFSYHDFLTITQKVPPEELPFATSVESLNLTYRSELGLSAV